MPQGPRGCIEQNLPLLQTCFFLVSTSRTTHIVVCHKKPRLNGDCNCSGHTPATSVPTPTETSTRPNTTTITTSAALRTSSRSLRSLRNQVSENLQENANTTTTRNNCPLCEKKHLQLLAAWIDTSDNLTPSLWQVQYSH